MLQTRLNALWVFVVSFLGLSGLLFLAADQLQVAGNHNGRIFSTAKEQVAAKGDLYLLGVGKADITGFVDEWHLCLSSN